MTVLKEVLLGREQRFPLTGQPELHARAVDTMTSLARVGVEQRVHLAHRPAASAKTCRTEAEVEPARYDGTRDGAARQEERVKNNVAMHNSSGYA